MLLFKPKPTHQGFTMIDVLTGMLMTTLFFSVAMQVLVMGSLYRVKAQKTQKANLWIQEDMERVQLAASQELTQNNQKCSAATYQDGYAQALADLLPAPTPQTLLNKTYQIDRVYDTSSSVSPYRTLKINYEVKEWNGTQFIGTPIAKNYLEVTPNVALRCY